jgi:hypothetical protein
MENLLTIGVAKFESAKGARQAQDWMHGQDLMQPCFSKCIYSASKLPIPGVPDATGVQQVPSVNDAPTHYLVEFVVGPYLYLTTADGDAQDAKTVVAGLQGFYKSVKGLKD